MAVVFSAVADHGGVYGPFNAERTLVFNTNITNSGNAYNSSSGIFTAPVAGFYYFCFYFRSGGKVKSGLSLVKNGEVVVQTSDSVSNDDSVDNGGNAVILKLQAGDKMFVRMQKQTQLWASDNTTTFSGYLISEI